ncbi:MAG: hypothetical protein H7Z42_03935 [Roseiflexaceae bacterium]|nr:hypothetical protein [Roseiflexaceae bacterium]
MFETGIYLPTGAGKVAFALRSELGDAIANLLVDGETASGIHELTASETWSYHDVADALTELSGKNVTYTPIEKPEFEARMRERGAPDRMIQFSIRPKSSFQIMGSPSTPTHEDVGCIARGH